MNPAVGSLKQYQELCFSLSEQQAGASKTGLKRLESSLQKALEKIPPEIRETADLLHRKNPLILASVTRNSCSACRQVLPSALAYMVRTRPELQRCPGCGRFLYIEEEPLRQTGKRVASFAGKGPSGIAQYSSEALMVPQLAAKTAEEAIRELAARLSEEGYIEDAEGLAALALEREKIAPSAVEKGIAFPHVRGIEGGGLTAAVGLKRGGLDFDSPDSVKTKIVILTIIPTAAGQVYLRLLSALTQALRETEPRNRLIACKTAEEMWETLGELLGAMMK